MSCMYVWLYSSWKIKKPDRSRWQVSSLFSFANNVPLLQDLALMPRKPQRQYRYGESSVNLDLLFILSQCGNCGSDGRVGGDFSIEGLAVQIPAPTVGMLKCPWTKH